MINSIVNALSGLPKELITLIIASLPVAELRVAIPVAMAMGQPPLKTFILAIIGNLLPVPFLLFLFEPVSNKLRHFFLWRRFFDWLFERTRRKASLVEKYEALGLILFVAIPLPVTGAWTGCVAATLFKIRFRYAFPAIACGVFIAACIVTAITLAVRI